MDNAKEEEDDKDAAATVEEAPLATDEHALPPCVFDEHYLPTHEFGGGAASPNANVDAPPLGYFIYDGPQDFHGQVVVF
jgi:hypothetical protein